MIAYCILYANDTYTVTSTRCWDEKLKSINLTQRKSVRVTNAQSIKWHQVYEMVTIVSYIGWSSRYGPHIWNGIKSFCAEYSLRYYFCHMTNRCRLVDVSMLHTSELHLHVISISIKLGNLLKSKSIYSLKRD